MNISRKHLLIFGFAFLTWIGIVLLSTYFFIHTGTITPIDVFHFVIVNLIAFPHFVAAAIGFIGSRKLGYSSSVGKALFFLGLGLVFFALGFYAWYVYETILGETELYPSIADFFYIAFIPLAIIGLYYLLKIYSLEITLKKITLALILSVLAGAIMFKTANLELPDITGVLDLTQIFNVFYTFADVVLVGLAVVVLTIAGGRIFSGLAWLSCGLFCMALADIIFFARDEAGISYTGDIADMAYLLSACVMALGMYYTARNFLVNSHTHNNV